MLHRISRDAFIAAACWVVLLLISNVAGAESQFNPLDWSRAHTVPLLVAQLSSPSSTLERPVETLRAEHVTAIRRFIEAIDDHRATDAVDMLSTELVPDGAARQQWLQQFSAIMSIHVVAIEPSAIGTAEPCYQYKAKLEIRVSANSGTAVPFYGWDDNPNFRWIRLCPNGNNGWAISSFGTGP